MKTPIQIIEDFGAPTNSYIKCVLFFRSEEGPVLSKEEHEKGIADIIGAETPPTFETEKESQLYFLYAVQETVRAFLGPTVPDMDEIWTIAHNKCTTFIKENPWCLIEDSEEGEGKSKVQKKDRARDLYKKLNDGVSTRKTIIETLMKELDMSKAGATTYFHNMKKKYGYKNPESSKKPNEKTAHATHITRGSVPNTKNSKRAIATQIYTDMRGSDKKSVIKEIVRQTGTSPAGANTYYCSAKKQTGG